MVDNYFCSILLYSTKKKHVAIQACAFENGIKLWHQRHVPDLDDIDK